MADTFKGIITADGKKRQLPYGSVLDKPVSDETLSIEGGFADAKVVGGNFKKVNAETASLKEDFANNGLSISIKLNESMFGVPYKTNCFAFSRDNSQIGKYIDDIATSSSIGANIYLIDITDSIYIAFRVFKTSSKGGSYFLDEKKMCIAELLNDTDNTGTEIKYKVPDNAKYLLYSVSKALYDTGLDIYVKKVTKSLIDDKINKGEKAYNNIHVGIDSIIDLDGLPTITGTVQATGKWGSVGTPYYQTTVLSENIPNKINVIANSKKNTYVSLLKSVPLETRREKVDFCLSETGRHQINAGDSEIINIPSDCVCIVFTKYSSQELTSYLPTCTAFYKPISDSVKDIQNDVLKLSNMIKVADYKANTNRNICLCATKTDIVNNKIPFTRGYIFHKFVNDDKSIYYGENFNDIKKIGEVDIYPTNYLVACSPTDGRLIFANRNQRGSLCIWDGNTTIKLFENAALKPMGWLYNSGVEFTKDSTGKEICLFAEYTNTPGTYATDGYKVWRGEYPYTSESDWNIVFSQNYGSNPSTDITHFHQIRRDPWTEILYLTSGDDSALSKWWYSTDYGLTWNLLTTGQSSGFEEHICRCINFCFTKDLIYFATDKGTNHCLNKISRNADTHIIDVSTRQKVCDLPAGRATNSICYVDSPKGIFMYDRVDIGFTDYYDKGFDVQFWSIENEKLYTLMHIDLITNTWGGHRGKCYLNYTNSVQPYPAMGFSIDSPCIFDIVSDDVSKIGTVYYEIMNKVLRTLIN